MPAEEQINRQTEGMAWIRMVHPASSALRTHPAVAPIRSIHIAKTCLAHTCKSKRYQARQQHCQCWIDNPSANFIHRDSPAKC